MNKHLLNSGFATLICLALNLGACADRPLEDVTENLESNQAGITTLTNTLEQLGNDFCSGEAKMTTNGSPTPAKHIWAEQVIDNDFGVPDGQWIAICWQNEEINISQTGRSFYGTCLFVNLAQATRNTWLDISGQADLVNSGYGWAGYEDSVHRIAGSSTCRSAESFVSLGAMYMSEGELPEIEICVSVDDSTKLFGKVRVEK